jgi:ribosomal protein S6--L-glutamate ligase
VPRVKIAVLSRGPELYSTKRLLEAIEARGHEPVLLDHTRCYIDIEHRRPSVWHAGERVEGLDAIIPRIGPSVTQYGAAIIRQFEMQKVYSTVRSIALTRSRDKLRSLQLLGTAGVDIPRTAFARRADDIDDLLAKVGGTPAIIKILEGTQGVGVVLAETKKAATSVIQAFYGLKVNILVQEYIKESKGADLRLFVVGNRVVGAMLRQGMGDDFRANLHLGGTGTSVKITQKERRIAVKAAKTLGLPVAGVDVLRSTRGPLVIEVNSSPGLRGIEEVTGVDVAGAIVQYVEEHVPRKRTGDKIGA